MKRSLMLYFLVLSSITALMTAENDIFFSKNASSDFIIRWAFQKECDHVFDPRKSPYVWPTSSRGVSFDPARVNAGDCIFVRNVDLFFKDYHPRIVSPYILITHGENLDAVKDRHLDYLEDQKVIAWFGIHPCAKKHPRFYALPLGILQDPNNYKNREKLNKFLENLRVHSHKDHLLYMNFADDQKPERKKLKALLLHKNYCKRGARQSFLQYLTEMSHCIFTLAPKGLGPDSYRIWESLLVGSIPIIKTSQLDPLFKELPVLVVSHWEEITQEFLEKKQVEIASKKYNLKRLYMSYWRAKIKKIKYRFLARYNL
ncbi:hypothetical protein H0X06_05165 [Candidatus Dependentiae bacterium]|nr:hypothetical protein [Candidatus Dependentiae bacterium]